MRWICYQLTVQLSLVNVCAEGESSGTGGLQRESGTLTGSADNSVASFGEPRVHTLTTLLLPKTKVAFFSLAESWALLGHLYHWINVRCYRELLLNHVLHRTIADVWIYG